MKKLNAPRSKFVRSSNHSSKAGATTKNTPAVLNKEARMRILTSELVSRVEIARKLGYSYKGKRDIYEILGYDRNPDYDSFYAMYKRGGFAKRIINAPVSTSWRGNPEISEKEKKQTEFEKSWKKLVKKVKAFRNFRRADKLSRIGHYAILLMGFNDGKDLSIPVTNATELLYLQPYSEKSAEIYSIEKNKASERYGFPTAYKIRTSDVTNPTEISEVLVHHSRVIHITEDLMTDNILSEPAIECIFNNLQNIDLISGGSSEMFWRGAMPGLAFKADPDAQFGTEDDLDSLEDEIQEYLLGLKRYLRLQGLDVEQLSPQVADPASHIAVQVDIIAGTIGIPKRILVGSERGELASSQDQVAWNRMMDERRVDFCEPIILEPFIDKMIEVGVLPEPQKEYEIRWKSLFQPTEHEKALIAKTKSDALIAYSNTLGVEKIIPPDVFLEKILGMSPEEVQQIRDILGHEIGKGREEAMAKATAAKSRASADPRKLKKASKISNNSEE